MSTEETAARYRQVLAWRDEGLNYPVIGERLGVGPARASNLHRAAMRWRRRLSQVLPPTLPQALPPTLPHAHTPDQSVVRRSIPPRAKAALHQRGLHTIEDVAALSDVALLGIGHIGPHTVAAIRASLEQQDV